MRSKRSGFCRIMNGDLTSTKNRHPPTPPNNADGSAQLLVAFEGSGERGSNPQHSAWKAIQRWLDRRPDAARGGWGTGKGPRRATKLIQPDTRPEPPARYQRDPLQGNGDRAWCRPLVAPREHDTRSGRRRVALILVICSDDASRTVSGGRTAARASLSGRAISKTSPFTRLKISACFAFVRATPGGDDTSSCVPKAIGRAGTSKTRWTWSRTVNACDRVTEPTMVADHPICGRGCRTKNGRSGSAFNAS